MDKNRRVSQYQQNENVNEAKIFTNDNNVGAIDVNVGVKLTETQKRVYGLIKENSNITHAAIARTLSITSKTAERATKALREFGLLRREGSDKTDKWIILKYILTLFAVMWSAVVGVEAREPERGYRGFADLNFALMLNGGYGDPDIYYGISTSHGYQFNPHLFVGAGLEWEHVHEAGYLWEVGQMPVFIHARTDWTLKNRYPVYGDLRVGGVIFGEYRLYIAPTVGYRFNWGKKLGLNLGAGVTLRGYGWSDTKTIHPLPTFRLGLDF